MNKIKHGFNIICGVFEVLFGLATLIGGAYLLYLWGLANKSSVILSGLFNKILLLIGADKAWMAKFIAPAAIALFGMFMTINGSRLNKKAYDTETKRYRQKMFSAVVGIIFCAAAAYVCYWGFFDDPSLNMYTIAAIAAFGILALFNFLSLFFTHDNKQVKDIKSQETKTAYNSANAAIGASFISAKEFEERGEELIKYLKRKKLSPEEFTACIQGLVRLPVDAPVDFKMNFIQKLSGKGFLKDNAFKVLIIDALYSPCTSNLKAKTRYLERLHKKGMVDETTYKQILQQLLSSI